MKPTLNFVVALAILLILACMTPFLGLIIPIAVLFIVSLISLLIDWNYNKEMTGDFDE